MLDNALMAFDVLWPQYRTQFDAHITISWGGLAGTADAIKLGIARSLISWNSDLRTTLKPYGLLKRDARIKERKKPGLVKARKAHKRSKR
jgi:small subunit ribosomal protein S9